MGVFYLNLVMVAMATVHYVETRPKGIVTAKPTSLSNLEMDLYVSDIHSSWLNHNVTRPVKRSAPRQYSEDLGQGISQLHPDITSSQQMLQQSPLKTNILQHQRLELQHHRRPQNVQQQQLQHLLQLQPQQQQLRKQQNDLQIQQGQFQPQLHRHHLQQRHNQQQQQHVQQHVRPLQQQQQGLLQRQLRSPFNHRPILQKSVPSTEHQAQRSRQHQQRQQNHPNLSRRHQNITSSQSSSANTHLSREMVSAKIPTQQPVQSISRNGAIVSRANANQRPNLKSLFSTSHIYGDKMNRNMSFRSTIFNPANGSISAFNAFNRNGILSRVASEKFPPTTAFMINQRIPSTRKEAGRRSVQRQLDNSLNPLTSRRQRWFRNASSPSLDHNSRRYYFAGKMPSAVSSVQRRKHSGNSNLNNKKIQLLREQQQRIQQHIQRLQSDEMNHRLQHNHNRVHPQQQRKEGQTQRHFPRQDLLHPAHTETSIKQQHQELRNYNRPQQQDNRGNGQISRIVQEHSRQQQNPALHIHSGHINKISRPMFGNQNTLAPRLNIIAQHQNVLVQHQSTLAQEQNAFPSHQGPPGPHQNAFAQNRNAFAQNQNSFAPDQSGLAQHQNSLATDQNGLVLRQNTLALHQNATQMATVSRNQNKRSQMNITTSNKRNTIIAPVNMDQLHQPSRLLQRFSLQNTNDNLTLPYQNANAIPNGTVMASELLDSVGSNNTLPILNNQQKQHQRNQLQINHHHQRQRQQKQEQPQKRKHIHDHQPQPIVNPGISRPDITNGSLQGFIQKQIQNEFWRQFMLMIQQMSVSQQQNEQQLQIKSETKIQNVTNLTPNTNPSIGFRKEVTVFTFATSTVSPPSASLHSLTGHGHKPQIQAFENTPQTSLPHRKSISFHPAPDKTTTPPSKMKSTASLVGNLSNSTKDKRSSPVVSPTIVKLYNSSITIPADIENNPILKAAYLEVILKVKAKEEVERLLSEQHRHYNQMQQNLLYQQLQQSNNVPDPTRILITGKDPENTEPNHSTTNRQEVDQGNVAPASDGGHDAAVTADGIIASAGGVDDMLHRDAEHNRLNSYLNKDRAFGPLYDRNLPLKPALFLTWYLKSSDVAQLRGSGFQTILNRLEELLPPTNAAQNSSLEKFRRFLIKTLQHDRHSRIFTHNLHSQENRYYSRLDQGPSILIKELKPGFIQGKISSRLDQEGKNRGIQYNGDTMEPVFRFVWLLSQDIDIRNPHSVIEYIMKTFNQAKPSSEDFTNTSISSSTTSSSGQPYSLSSPFPFQLEKSLRSVFIPSSANDAKIPRVTNETFEVNSVKSNGLNLLELDSKLSYLIRLMEMGRRIPDLQGTDSSHQLNNSQPRLRDNHHWSNIFTNMSINPRDTELGNGVGFNNNNNLNLRKGNNRFVRHDALGNNNDNNNNNGNNNKNSNNNISLKIEGLSSRKSIANNNKTHLEVHSLVTHGHEEELPSLSSKIHGRQSGTISQGASDIKIRQLNPVIVPVQKYQSQRGSNVNVASTRHFHAHSFDSTSQPSWVSNTSLSHVSGENLTTPTIFNSSIVPQHTRDPHRFGQYNGVFSLNHQNHMGYSQAPQAPTNYNIDRNQFSQNERRDFLILRQQQPLRQNNSLANTTLFSTTLWHQYPQQYSQEQEKSVPGNQTHEPLQQIQQLHLAVPKTSNQIPNMRDWNSRLSEPVQIYKAHFHEWHNHNSSHLHGSNGTDRHNNNKDIHSNIINNEIINRSDYRNLTFPNASIYNIHATSSSSKLANNVSTRLLGQNQDQNQHQQLNEVKQHQARNQYQKRRNQTLQLSVSNKHAQTSLQTDPAHYHLPDNEMVNKSNTPLQSVDFLNLMQFLSLTHQSQEPETVREQRMAYAHDNWQRKQNPQQTLHGHLNQSNYNNRKNTHQLNQNNTQHIHQSEQSNIHLIHQLNQNKTISINQLYYNKTQAINQPNHNSRDFIHQLNMFRHRSSPLTTQSLMTSEHRNQSHLRQGYQAWHGYSTTISVPFTFYGGVKRGQSHYIQTVTKSPINGTNDSFKIYNRERHSGSNMTLDRMLLSLLTTTQSPNLPQISKGLFTVNPIFPPSVGNAQAESHGPVLKTSHVLETFLPRPKPAKDLGDNQSFIITTSPPQNFPGPVRNVNQSQLIETDSKTNATNIWLTNHQKLNVTHIVDQKPLKQHGLLNINHPALHLPQVTQLNNSYAPSFNIASSVIGPHQGGLGVTPQTDIFHAPLQPGFMIRGDISHGSAQQGVITQAGISHVPEQSGVIPQTGISHAPMQQSVTAPDVHASNKNQSPLPEQLETGNAQSTIRDVANNYGYQTETQVSRTELNGTTNVPLIIPGTHAARSLNSINNSHKNKSQPADHALYHLDTLISPNQFIFQQPQTLNGVKAVEEPHHPGHHNIVTNLGLQQTDSLRDSLESIAHQQQLKHLLSRNELISHRRQQQSYQNASQSKGQADMSQYQGQTGVESNWKQNNHQQREHLQHQHQIPQHHESFHQQHQSSFQQDQYQQHQVPFHQQNPHHQNQVLHHQSNSDKQQSKISQQNSQPQQQTPHTQEDSLQKYQISLHHQDRHEQQHDISFQQHNSHDHHHQQRQIRHQQQNSNQQQQHLAPYQQTQLNQYQPIPQEYPHNDTQQSSRNTHYYHQHRLHQHYHYQQQQQIRKPTHLPLETVDSNTDLTSGKKINMDTTTLGRPSSQISDNYRPDFYNPKKLMLSDFSSYSEQTNQHQEKRNTKLETTPAPLCPNQQEVRCSPIRSNSRLNVFCDSRCDVTSGICDSSLCSCRCYDVFNGLSSLVQDPPSTIRSHDFVISVHDPDTVTQFPLAPSDSIPKHIMVITTQPAVQTLPSDTQDLFSGLSRLFDAWSRGEHGNGKTSSNSQKDGEETNGEKEYDY